jgi:NADP-dependent 3-hydroxy acid dehydrogenase YdfG
MNMERIAGKVVVITGVSSGLGESTARHLADLGAKVVLGARHCLASERANVLTDHRRSTIANPAGSTKPQIVAMKVDGRVRCSAGMTTSHFENGTMRALSVL